MDFLTISDKFHCFAFLNCHPTRSVSCDSPSEEEFFQEKQEKLFLDKVDPFRVSLPDLAGA